MRLFTTLLALFLAAVAMTFAQPSSSRYFPRRPTRRCPFISAVKATF